MNSADKLVMMANQIAKAFAARPEEAVSATAGHMRAFWAPAMRARIVAHHQAGEPGLSPIAASAVAELAAGGT
jgi:formate dehydrogenase subunit delta